MKKNNKCLAGRRLKAAFVLGPCLACLCFGFAGASLAKSRIEMAIGHQEDDTGEDDFSSYDSSQTEEAISAEFAKPNTILRRLDLLVWHAIVSDYKELAPTFRSLVGLSLGKGGQWQGRCWPLLVALDEWGDIQFVEDLVLCGEEEEKLVAFALRLLAGHEGQLDVVLEKIDGLIKNCAGECGGLRETYNDLIVSRTLLAGIIAASDDNENITTWITYAGDGFLVAFGGDPIRDPRRLWPVVRFARGKLQELDGDGLGREQLVQALNAWNVRTAFSEDPWHLGKPGEDPELDQLAAQYNAAMRAFVKQILSEETQALVAE